MKLSEAFPSNYLKSDDLQGRDVSVVIAGAALEKVGSDTRLVLTFRGKSKSMICNKTNAGRIAYMYGDDTDNWVGQEIIITSEFVEYQGKTVKGLRVRPPQRQTVSVASGSITTAPQRMAEQPMNGDEPPPHDEADIPF